MNRIHTAHLTVARADGQGTFQLDGTDFPLACFFISTSAWEHH